MLAAFVNRLHGKGMPRFVYNVVTSVSADEMLNEESIVPVQSGKADFGNVT